MKTIGKIISGGQTGADRGAIAAALKAKFPYGGLIPKGRLAEDGRVPLRFRCMEEADTEDYRFRTRWNAEHSDATLILAFDPKLEGGTQRTRQYCMNVRKPYFVDNPSDPKMDGDRLAVFTWLEKVVKKNKEQPLVLNVAGPRESKSPGLAKATDEYITRLLVEQERNALVGRQFRHFKGNLYRIEGFAKDSETLEEMVVYRALYGEHGLWVRPAKMFFETIEREGKTMRRFELVEDAG